MATRLPATLIRKIKNKKARIGVIGLGYVGLPLAVEFAKVGFTAVGIDTSAKRVKAINQGRSYIPDIATAEIRVLVKAKKLKATTRFSALAQCDAVMICVPTPLRKTKDPDISYIVSAAEALAKHLHRNQVIILESTTYPGTTREVILPILTRSGLKVGKDFFLGFSPERIDPGNEKYTTTNIPKVVSGITLSCCSAIKQLYGQVIEQVIPVSSTEVAEMVKLLENTFRSVNIGLVNELALMCHKLKVDVWEVIDAAKTKPFGFMPFYPGPGLGGHCIPIDPLYLSWKAKLHGFEPRFIELASEVNAFMPEHVVNRVVQELGNKKKSLKGAKILLLGVAYKPDVGDTRESPALEIFQLMLQQRARMQYHDPFVKSLRVGKSTFRSTALTARLLKSVDCVVIVTNHQNVPYDRVVEHASLILDTRNSIGHRLRRVARL